MYMYSDSAELSNKYDFSIKISTITAHKFMMTITHQRSIFKVQKPVEVPI
jgi:hypothetical protein